MKTYTKLLTTLLLTTLFLTACGGKTGSSSENKEQPSTNTQTTGTDITPGTDTSSTNTDIVDENIELTEVIDDVVYKSNTTTGSESFPSGGLGTFENNVLSLSNLTGGDSISFLVDISNDSTTSFLYRRSIKVIEDNGLFNLLQFELNNEKLILGHTAYARKTASWSGENYDLTITLPKGLEDSVKNRSCKIEISYETLSSGTEYSKYSVNQDTFTSFDSAVQSVTNGSTLTLNENVNILTDFATRGYSVTFPSTASELTIEGNGNSIRFGGTYSANINPNSGNGSPAGFTYSNLSGSSRMAPGKKMTIKNVHFYNEKEYSAIQYPERVVSYMYFFAENTTFENCTFDNGVVVFGNVKFTNCTFTVDKTNMYNVFVDHEKGEATTTTVEATGCNFLAENTAYGDFKTAGENGSTINLTLKNNLFKNDTSKSAAYINGKTYVTASNNTYVGLNSNGIVSKGSECTLNGETMVAGQSYEI
ncbi:MAG: hypothetical protein MJ248_05485 [Bacilli bacterium]|nr:hypothetical protein [Bacilli bacterium]